MTTPLIDVREVSRRDAGGPPALPKVSLDSVAGEAVAVLGPPGERKARYRAGRLRAGLGTATRRVA